MGGFELISGLAVGLAFGYALQRGRFCVNTGFRDILMVKDSTMFRAWALAVIVQMAGVTVLSGLDFMPITVPPFWWAANIAGGLMFGVGMVLAGGCSSGTCYRVGEGMAGSLLALVGFGLGILLADRGALQPLQDVLRSDIVFVGGEQATLANVIGINPMWVGLAIPLAVGVWLWRGGSGNRQYASGGWAWHMSGFALGAIGIAAWLSSSSVGREFGLSMTGPIRTWFVLALSGENYLDWGSVMIAGLIVGSFVAAWVHQELRWRVPRGSRMLQAGGGGIFMGVGAQIAGGCNIGHSMTGMSVLSLGSVVTTFSILLGAWLMAYILFIRPMAAQSV